MLEPIKLTKSRYKLLVYDKYEKCRGLHGVELETNSLTEILGYFTRTFEKGENERADNLGIMGSIEVGEDLTNNFQLYDCLKNEYVDGNYEGVWEYVQKLYEHEKFNVGNKKVNDAKLTSADYSLIAMVEDNSIKEDIGTFETLIFNTNYRQDIVDLLTGKEDDTFKHLTLYLNKEGTRYFGNAKQLIHQLNSGNELDEKDDAYTETVIQDLYKERLIQRGMWGNQEHGLHKWNTILVEEVGEVAQAIQSVDKTCTWAKEEDKNNLYDELIQVAGVAVSFAEYLNKKGIGRTIKSQNTPIKELGKMNKVNDIANRIKETRIQKYMTQEKLAYELDITQGALSHYENGRIIPPDKMKVKIANILGVTVSYLKGETDI